MVTKKLKKFGQIVYTTAKDFSLNTNLHGYRHIVEDDRHWIERVIWIIIQLLATSCIIYSVLDVYNKFVKTPTVTTIETSQYPIWNVPFPAVAVCNVNKISKSKARLFANALKKSNGNYSEEDLFQLLRYLGKIYEQEVQGYDQIKELHHVLDRHKQNYNISEVLKYLAPRCEDVLIRCMWEGRRENCSEMFELMNTVNGYCCVFNKIQTMKGSNRTTSAGRRLTSTGYHMGLNLLIDPQPVDYFYPIMPTYGVQIVVFNNKDHLDSPNGLLEKLVPSNREIFFTLDTKSRYSEPEVRALPIEERACLFDDEAALVIPGEAHYSYGRCLSKCTRSETVRLCGCLPYYFEDLDYSRICHLQDVPCLLQNKEKFENRRLKGWSSNVFTANDSVPCEECFPSCSDTWYEVTSSYSYMQVPNTRKSQLTDGIEITRNHSIAHLYYDTLDTLLYKQDILFSWHELVSNCGGIGMLFNGFGFISVVEFFYFLTFRFFQALKNFNQPENDSSESVDNTEIHRTTRIRLPYLNEITPRI